MFVADRRRSHERRQCAVMATDSEWNELKRRAQDAGVSRFERLMTEPPEPPGRPGADRAGGDGSLRGGEGAPVRGGLAGLRVRTVQPRRLADQEMPSAPFRRTDMAAPIRSAAASTSLSATCAASSARSGGRAGAPPPAAERPASPHGWRRYAADRAGGHPRSRPASALPYQSGRFLPIGRAGSDADGKTYGLPVRGWRSTRARACAFRKTLLGPVLPSARSRTAPSTSRHCRRTISFRRQPVASNRRTMSACRLRDSVADGGAHLSSSRCRRRISSRDRKRVSFGRGFLLTPRAGFFSIRPLATARFRICLNTSRAWLAPPGAVLLYRSNHRLTSTATIRSSGRAPKAGSNCLRLRSAFA